MTRQELESNVRQAQHLASMWESRKLDAERMIAHWRREENKHRAAIRRLDNGHVPA